jgi:hypothetical protein
VGYVFPEIAIGIVFVGSEACVANETALDYGTACVDVVYFDGAAYSFGAIGVCLIEMDEIVFEFGDGLVKIGVKDGIIIEEID